MEDIDLLDIDAAISTSFQADEEPQESAEETEAGDEAGTAEDGEEKPVKDGGEESDEGDEKDDQKPKDKPEEKPKKSRAAERIESLARERRELRQQLAELQKQIRERPPELPPQPNPGEYKTQREYDFAMGQYQAKVEAAQAEHGQAEERRVERERTAYQDRILKEKAKHADFDKVVSTLGDIPISPELHDALYGCDNPADILYFLGKNPAIADHVLSMSGRQQTIKLAEISVKLAAAQKPKNIKSAAPKPPEKPKGSSAATAGGYSENMSFEDHCKYMRKLEAQKRKARYG
jgi:hypothetical protein